MNETARDVVNTPVATTIPESHVARLSHFDIRDGRVVEEWTMFNEFSVMRQIYAAEA